MKIFPRFLFLVVVLIAACTHDDEPVNLPSRELLMKYDWIVFSVVQQNGTISDGEPGIFYNVLKFDETNFSGSDHTGEFYDLGEWSLDEDILIMDGESYPIIELTAQKLVYEAPDERIVTRLAIEEVVGN